MIRCNFLLLLILGAYPGGISSAESSLVPRLSGSLMWRLVTFTGFCSYSLVQNYREYKYIKKTCFQTNTHLHVLHQSPIQNVSPFCFHYLCDAFWHSAQRFRTYILDLKLHYYLDNASSTLEAPGDAKHAEKMFCGCVCFHDTGSRTPLTGTMQHNIM